MLWCDILPYQLRKFFRFGRKSASFIIQAGDLPFQLANTPGAFDTFYFVECAFEFIMNAEELLDVGIRKFRQDKFAAYLFRKIRFCGQ